MTRQSLVASLIPAAYREQVLGDLHERGFRLRDIASVVPRIWWSHLHRTSAPGGDSEQVLQRGLQQIEVRLRWSLWLWFAPLAARIPFGRGGLFEKSALIGIAALLLVVILRRPAQPGGRRAILQRHHYLLNWQYKTARFGVPYVFVALAMIRSVNALYVLEPTVQDSFKAVVIAGAFAYGQLRANQLRKELSKLA